MQAVSERDNAGLEGLVGGLDSVIITTEPDNLVPAVYELLRYTGLSCQEAFFNADAQSVCPWPPGISVPYHTVTWRGAKPVCRCQ